MKLTTTTRPFRFHTYASNGGRVDADSLPSASVYEDENDTPMHTPTVTKVSGETGHYRAAVVPSAANGFEVGKMYHVKAVAVIGGVTVETGIGRFIITQYDEDEAAAAAILGRQWRSNKMWPRDGAHADVQALEPSAVTGEVWMVLYDDAGTTPIKAQKQFDRLGNNPIFGGTGPAARDGAVP